MTVSSTILVSKVETLSEELLKKLETVPGEVEGSPEAFFLPGANPFIPKEFGLRADDDAAVAGGGATADPDAAAEAVRGLLPANIPALALETVPKEDWSRLLPPSLVVEGGGGGAVDGEAGAVSLWHKMDRSYRVPKSSIAAKLWTPEPYVSPMAAVQVRRHVVFVFFFVCVRCLRVFVFCVCAPLPWAGLWLGFRQFCVFVP